MERRGPPPLVSRKPHAQLARLLADEPGRFVFGHGRKIVDVALAMVTEANAVVAAHRLPIGLAGLGDLKDIQRSSCCTHGKPLARPRGPPMVFDAWRIGKF
jgi:hypothetical protein